VLVVVRGKRVLVLQKPTSHAAAIRVALDRLRANQGIIVVQPDKASLAIAMRCEDFSADIDAGRLWFTTGESWAQSLAELFQLQPGLPTPGHFIRLPVSDASARRSGARKQSCF